MKILAIRFARLGDVILLLPALTSIKRSLPDSLLTLLTGHRCAPIAELCPAVDEVISVDRIAMRDGPVFRAMMEAKKLVSDIRARHFDAVVDFHSFRETNLLTALSGARFRLGMRRSGAAYLKGCFNQPPVDEDKTLHVSEMFQRVAASLPGVVRHGLDESILAIPEPVKRWAEQAAAPGSRLTLYVDAPAPDRRWLPQFFAAVADHAVENLGAQVLVISSSSNAQIADAVRKSSHHSDRLSLFQDLNLSGLAALIGSSRLLVSNDTGPMHLGPALAVPTLGLFSVGLPEHFRPTGRHDRFLKGMPIERISVESVIRETCQMWVTACPGLRR